MSGVSVLQHFEAYQKARVTFVQAVAEAATRPQNIEVMQNAGVMQLLRPLLLDNVSAAATTVHCAVQHITGYLRQKNRATTHESIDIILPFGLRCFRIQYVGMTLHCLTVCTVVRRKSPYSYCMWDEISEYLGLVVCDHISSRMYVSSYVLHVG